jgi:hypothetical protein
MKLILLILVVLGALGYFFKDDMMREVQRVDANSPQALKSSIEEIGKGLSDEEKKVFAKGVAKMTGDGTTLTALLAMTAEDEIQWKTLTKNLNGKSVRQVLVKGKN